MKWYVRPYWVFFGLFCYASAIVRGANLNLTTIPWWTLARIAVASLILTIAIELTR